MSHLVPWKKLLGWKHIDTCKSWSNGILGPRDEVKYSMMSKKWQMLPFMTEKLADEGSFLFLSSEHDLLKFAMFLRRHRGHRKDPGRSSEDKVAQNHEGGGSHSISATDCKSMTIHALKSLVIAKILRKFLYAGKGNNHGYSDGDADS